MGVMSCYRSECPSIMCDTYVDGVGYVCRGCQDEFKDYLKANNTTVVTDMDIKRELEKFMETDKDSFTEGNEISVDDFFEGYTK